MRDWPEPIRPLRSYLPAEMRVLRGILGMIGGVALFGGVLVILLGGNWQLGYADSRFLASIFLALIPATIGIVSPAWYWLGRPAWYRLDRPGNHLLRRFRNARFVPGMVGTVLGIGLMAPVTATSGFWVQILVPFGLVIAIVSPLWFWLVRPIAHDRVEKWLPGDGSEQSLATFGMRLLPAVGTLFVVSVAITAVLALPIAAVGEPVSDDGLTITVTDIRTATEVAEVGSEDGRGDDAWRLLLVQIAVGNHGDTPRQLPGSSVGDISVIAPNCRANNFGEPSNNCNQLYLDGNITANGHEYVNYDSRQASTAGRIEPGDRITGWLVFRLETQPTNGAGFGAMIIVDDIGRWRIESK